MAQCDWEQFCENVVDKLNAEYAEVLKEKLALEQMVKKDLYEKCMKYIPLYRKDLFEFCQQSYNFCDFSGAWRCDPTYEDTSECLLEHIKTHPSVDCTLGNPQPLTSAEEYQWEVMMEGEDEDVEEENSHGLGNYD